MKKYLARAASPFFCAAFLFTGCYDAVYQSIRNEIPLEERTVPGFINSIVRFTDGGKEYLFMQNGRIHYKRADASSHGAWTQAPNTPKGLSFDFYSSSFSGTHFVKLAADDSNIYALGYEVEVGSINGRNVPKTVKLYCCSSVGGAWQEVSAVNAKIAAYVSGLNPYYYMTDASIHLFCTNAPQTANRKAYIRIGGGGGKGSGEVFELNGTGTTAAAATTGNGVSGNTSSAVYYGSGVHFLDALAAGTDETAAAAAKYVYYASGEKLSSFPVTSPSTVTSTDLSTSRDIISLAVTADSILLGTNGNGIFRVTHDNTGKPATSKSDFQTNAQNIMYSPYIVRALFCATPDKVETQADCYSSVQFRYTAQGASADHGSVGLWSYYPARGNWNKE
ncbi:MAG: hypothetical protein ACTTKL_04360 [Treponema sp.]